MRFFLAPKLTSFKKLTGFLKKSLALSLALLLCIEPCLHALPDPEAPAQSSGTSECIQTFLNTEQQNSLGKAGILEETFLPKALAEPGDFQTALRNPSLPLVIILQDAHGVLSAQKNIGKLLHHLTKEGALQEPWIALEGTEPGEIDHKALSQISDRKIRIRTALHFMEEAQLDGADYFTAAYAPQTRYFGIDSAQGMLKNVQSYRRLLPLRASAQKFIADWETLLAQLKKRIYPADLYTLDQPMQSLYANTPSPAIGQLLVLVQEFSRKYNLPLETYPALKAVCELHPLRKATSKDKSGKESANNLQRLYTTIRANHFTDELQAWHKALEYQLTRDLPEARTLAAISRAQQLHKHLLALTWTPQEQAAFVDNQSLSIQKALAQTRFLRFLFQQDPLPLWQTSDLQTFYKARREALRFYAAAREREPILETETQTLLTQAPDHKLFVILGGFHRDPFTQDLRAKNIPYLVLSPSITKNFSQQAYWRQLAGVPAGTISGSAPAIHLKLRSAWKNPGFPSAVAAYARHQATITPAASAHSSYPRHSSSGARTTPARLPTDLYAGLTAGRSEVRSTSSSDSPSRTSLRSVSTSVDFAENLELFFLDLTHQVFLGAANEVLPANTLDPYVLRYIAYLRSILGKNTGERTKLSVKGASPKMVQLDTEHRVLETHEHKTEYVLHFGVDLFTELAAQDTEFAAFFFILSLHQYFTRPVISLKSTTLASKLSLEPLFKSFFDSTDQPAPLSWDQPKRERFVSVIAAQLESIPGFSKEAAKLVGRIAGELKVEIPTETRDTSLLLPVSEPTFGDTSGNDTGNPTVSLAKDPNLAWFEETLTTGEVIGEGGFGVVVRAHNPELEATIIAKLIAPTFRAETQGGQLLSLPEAAIERLNREANALGVMDGNYAPKAVRRFGVNFKIPETGTLSAVAKQLGFDKYRGQTVRVEVIGMELAKGTNLGDITKALHKTSAELSKDPDSIRLKKLAADLKKTKNRSLQIRQWAVALARALKAVHENGILHRDIKPANMFVDKDNATLIDFGLAIFTGQPHRTSPVAPAVINPVAFTPAGTASPLDVLVDEMASTVLVASPSASGADDGDRLTSNGSIMGTPPFLLTMDVAPSPPLGTTTEAESSTISTWKINFRDTEAPDLWALGASLYELFTGQTPAAAVKIIKGNHIPKLMANAYGKYPDPRQLNPKLTLSEQYILLRLLGTLIPGMPPKLKDAFLELKNAPQRFDANYQPLEAYKNASEALRDLEALVAGKPLPSAPSRFFLRSRPKIQRVLDFVFRDLARNYTIHTVNPPIKILKPAAQKRFLSSWPESEKKPTVLQLAQKQGHAAQTRIGYALAAIAIGIFIGGGILYSLVLAYAALEARLNPPAPPRPEREVVIKEVQVPAPEQPKAFEWSMDIKHLQPYATVPQHPEDPKNTERVLKPKENVGFLAYSFGVADPNPEEGNPGGRNYMSRRAFQSNTNGYYPVEYAVNDIPVPFDIDTRVEMTTSVFFKADANNHGSGNLTLGMHDFENNTMRALFTFLTDSKPAGQFTLDRANPFPMDFNGGPDGVIRAAYNAARTNPLIQPNVTANFWHSVKIIKFAQGEKLPDSTVSDGKDAVLFIGEQDNPKSPLIAHPFRLVSSPTDPWPSTIKFTFFISGQEGSARLGPVDVTVKPSKATQHTPKNKPGIAQAQTQKSSTKNKSSANRSEVRHTSAIPVLEENAFNPQLAAVRRSDKTGLLWIEYNAANLETLSRQFLSKSALAFRSGARVLFVQQRGAENNIALPPGLRQRMALYGAAFAETDLPLEQLTPDSPAFENLMRQSQRLFGNSLGRPVILGRFTHGAPASSAPAEAQSVYYRIDFSKFSGKNFSAYGNAVLLSASRLSKQYTNPLEVIFNSDYTVSVAPDFVNWVSQAYEQILTIAYSA